MLSSGFIDSPHDELSGDNKPEKWIEIILDVTVLHPQGGGQPSDKGIIYNEKATALVDRVICLREANVVKHIGVLDTVAGDHSTSTESLFPTGSKVNVKVDPERREILSECHTAGHVVDAAMSRCNKILPPTKGYHFLDGPYVEYAGNIPTEEREELLHSLQTAFQVRMFCYSYYRKSTRPFSF